MFMYSNMLKLKRLCSVLALFIMPGVFAVQPVLAQTKQDLKSERIALKEAERLEKEIDKYQKSSAKERRAMERSASKSGESGQDLAAAVQDLSLRNFIRGGLAT